jgi:recombination protein RecA
MDIRKTETIKQGTDAVGTRVKVKIAKNKIAPPFKIAEFDIMFDKGISKESEIIDIGTNLNIIQKSGTWYSYGEERIGQGKEMAKKYVLDNPSIRDEIEKKILIKYFGEPVEKSVPDDQGKKAVAGKT